jgi:molybdopterin-containing oxidoreductase family membrane subunit
VALSGYLGINGIIVVWALFSWYRGGQVPMRLLKPCIYLSMAWGVFAHTVTAFLYSWVAARPFWNSAVMAPRFIASAFIVGPVFLVVSLQVIRKVTAFEVRDEVIHTLRKVIAVSALVNLFLLVSEVFSETYSGAHHGAPILYLFRGLVGSTLLVPFLWVAVISNVVAFVIFATPPLARRFPILNVGCALAFLGVWIEKGMGLIVPGFVPSPTGEVIEYIPSLVEFLVSLGIACLGMLVFTSLIKVGVPLELRAGGSPGTGSLKREVEP